MKQALLIIDIQNDYFLGGSNPLQGSEDAAWNASLLLNDFRTKGLPVIHIQHIATRPTATFFLPGTVGAEIHASIKPLEGEPVIVKHTPNSFQGTALLEQLRSLEVDQLVICGMMTHMCVDSTTRAAKDFGFDCILIDDACTTKALQFNGHTVPATEVQASLMAALSYYYSTVKTTAQFLKNELVMQNEMKIALLLYNGFTALDVVGPYEVLSKIPNAKIYFIAEKKGLYADTKGMQVMADTSLDELPFPDMLVIPGGFGIDALLTNETVLEWVRNAHEHSQWTVSVCSGALLLGVAGILNDKKATTHWNRKTQLVAYCSQILDERYVTDGKVITSAGVSAGIDMALYLLSLITNETYAKAVQLGMEYDPQPPFNCGSPRTAPPALVELVVNQRKK